MSSADYRVQPVERAVFGLRALYEGYGYKKYKMSKFEEYDLYLENKSFLPSPQIITFTGLNGRLLALKPDVTLSIAKNAPALSGATEKVYYNENVYRTSRGLHEYREIAQVGVELIGEVDLYSQCEVIGLACRSLELLSERYIITVSHMGFVSGLLESCALPFSLEAEILSLIEHKNAHEIAHVCDESGVSPEKRDALAALTALHGGFEDTLERALKLVCNDKMKEALDSLREIYSALPPEKSRRSLTLDFSVINDLSYYNGLIFQGYIPSVPRAILSGGRYDNLMERLGKEAGAIGFAVYVDELDHCAEEDEGYDADILLLYGDAVGASELVRATERLTASGKSVRAQKTAPESLRCRQILKIDADGRLETLG